MQLFCYFSYFLSSGELPSLSPLCSFIEKKTNKQKGELNETCTSRHDPEVINGQVSVTLISLLPIFFHPNDSVNIMLILFQRLQNTGGGFWA